MKQTSKYEGSLGVSSEFCTHNRVSSHKQSKRSQMIHSSTVNTVNTKASGSSCGSCFRPNEKLVYRIAQKSPTLTIDQLLTEVQAATSPFSTAKTSPPNSAQHAKSLKYYLYIAVFLPATVAVIAPSSLLDNIYGVDLAILFSNMLVLGLIIWTVKFVVEWPWKWLAKVKDVKRKLITSSNFKNENVKLELLKRVEYFEALALLSCLIVPMFGSFTMLVVRDHIKVDEKRKNLVFNGLHIASFALWSFFRWIMSLSETLHTSFSKSIAPKTELNVSYNEVDSDSGEKNVTNHRTVEERLLSLSTITDQSKHILDSLSTSQENGYKKIVNYLEKLEKSVSGLYRSSNGGSPKTDSVFLKPFPLNLNNEERSKSTPLSLRIHTLDTISEASSSGSTSPRESPIPEDSLQGTTLQSPFLKNNRFLPSSLTHQNSLHGVPWASYSEIEPEYEELDSTYSDNSDLKSILVVGTQRGLLFTKELGHLAVYLKENFTVLQFLQSPLEILRLVMIQFHNQLNDCENKDSKVDIRNSVLWNIVDHYVLDTTQFNVQLVGRVKSLIFKPIERIAKLIQNVMSLPFYMIGLWISINMFFPRLLLKIFIMFPYSVIKSGLEKRRINEPMVKVSKLEPMNDTLVDETPAYRHSFDMKKFRLSPSSESTMAPVWVNDQVI